MQEQERTLKVYVGEYVIQIMTHVVTHVIAAVLQVVVLLAPAKVLVEHVEDIVVIILVLITLVLITLVLGLLACSLYERDRGFFLEASAQNPDVRFYLIRFLPRDKIEQRR